MNVQNFIMMPIPADQYIRVCALLGGAALAATTVGGAGGERPFPTPSPQPTPSGDDTGADQNGAGGQSAPSGDAGASQPAGDGEIDAHGHPWSADLHASTKGKTKDGLWRMKVGVSRPDPLPGFPKDGNAAGTGTSSETPAPSATLPPATGSESAPSDTSGDDDEFAAFRAAAAAGDATDAAAAASVPARQFSDADLGALCNQAAVKLGDPTPIKEIIAKYTPEGQVAHSRNIPAEKREEFAQEVERTAGIQFAG